MKSILYSHSTVRLTKPSFNRIRHRLLSIPICLFLLLFTIPPFTHAEETIRVGYFDKKPVSFSGEEGHPRGFAVDILTDIAEENRWKLTYIHGSFPESFKRLKSGKIDLMLPIGYSASRKVDIDYSDEPLLSSWGCLFTQRGGSIKSLADISGQRIAYFKTSLFYKSLHNILNGLGLTADFIEVDSYNEIFSGIAAGRFDAGAGDRLALVGLEPEVEQEIDGSIVFHPFALHVAVTDGDPKDLLSKIDHYLHKGRSTPDSRYSKHLNYWLSGTAGRPSALPQTLAITLVLILLGSLLYILSRISAIRRTLGLTEIVEARASLNILIISWAIGAFYWVGDSLVEYFWVNPSHKSYLSLFLSRDNLHEVSMRLSFVGVVVLGGIIISRIFARLTAAQTETKKTAENLRTTLYSIGDAVIATNTDGAIVRMNPVAAKLTGWTAEEASQRPLTEVFHIINAQTREPVENPTNQVLENGKIVDLANHTILVAKDGEEYQIADSAAPIRDANSNITGVVLVFRDVTEKYSLQESLKKTQNYLSNIINSMPSVLVGVNIDGEVTQWNSEAEQFTDIATENALGRSLAEVFPRLSIEMPRVREAIQNRQTQFNPKQTCPESEETCYEDITIYPLVANGVEGAVIRVDNVTERVQMEEMMVQTEKMLSIGGLAAGMAHEINNPLGIISQAAQNAMRRLSTTLPANQKIAAELGIDLKQIDTYLKKREIPRFLENIKTAVNRSSEIIQNMLNFSTTNASQRETCCITDIIKESLTLAHSDYDLKKKFDFRNIQIETHLAEDLPQISINRIEIQQVVFNLLKNASQAMNDVSRDNYLPKITITASADQDNLTLKLTDNGPGMPAAIKARIFEPFYTTKEIGAGTGLGLSVSYFIIVKRHQGQFQVESEEDKGTSFTITLPRGN